MDKLPVGPTIFFGLLYVIMPILPEPHLVQKAMMLMNGLHLAPIDWFDIVAHSGGGLLAFVVYRRSRQVGNTAKNGDVS
ncbi:hypothetical protein BEN30_01190 [Magnetovibrio blakemorei]|uniref:VanZ-like domain-containing protein n=1 Tax=Magnetovibrio blakemorei TaxID=28181 RepID=A0A1E5Q3R9_9PROT|nr:hypothetical protein BEN30_01190 [Magnetovibrio blakemorei]